MRLESSSICSQVAVAVGGPAVSVRHCAKMRLAIVVVLLAGACGGPPPPGTRSGAARGETLYERLGGQEVVRAIVDDFVAIVAADGRINRLLVDLDIAQLKRTLVARLCARVGGPCQLASSADASSTLRALGGSAADRGVMIEDLAKALERRQMPARLRDELLAAM